MWNFYWLAICFPFLLFNYYLLFGVKYVYIRKSEWKRSGQRRLWIVKLEKERKKKKQGKGRRWVQI